MCVLCTHSKPSAAQRKGCSWSTALCRRALDCPAGPGEQDQGSTESLCQLSWLLGGSLVPPHLLDAHRGPFLCSPPKFRSAVASLSTTALPHFWVSPRLSQQPCRELIPPWPIPPLKSESYSWSGNICITPLSGPMFSPVIQFSFWSIQLGNLSGRGNRTLGDGFSSAYNRVSLAVPVCCYHSHRVTTQSTCCRNPGVPFLTPGLPWAAAQPTGSIWQHHMLLHLPQ